jgi:hypothetical protein
MSVRTISYKINNLSTVTPFPPQWGGIQGEDNATRVEYEVDWQEIGAITEGKARIDFNSPTAGYDPSKHYDVNDTLARDIPIKMTQSGGQITSTLVIENADGIVLSIPSVIYFTPAKKQDGRVIAYLSGFEQSILESVAEAREIKEETEKIKEDAQNAAIASESSAQTASAQVTLIENKIASGEFKGDKGDKGDAYILTEADKDEIADIVKAEMFIDVSEVGQ